MAVSLSYLALNYIGVPWLKAAFGDVTAFQSFMYMLCFEACIACGYIHSNSRYADLFASSVGTSAEITDRIFNIRYAALNTEAIPKYDMKKALQSPVTRKNGLTVHAMPISGGYAVWTEDMSALLAVKAESESLADVNYIPDKKLAEEARPVLSDGVNAAIWNARRCVWDGKSTDPLCLEWKHIKEESDDAFIF